MSTTTASNGQSGFRAANLGPEELERFAALFVPPWEMPADDAAAAPDPGFKAAPLGALLAAELVPRGSSRPPAMAPEAPRPLPIKSTMVEVAPPVQVVAQAAPAIARPPAPAPSKAAFEPMASLADLDEAPKPKSKMPLIVGGGLALAAAIVIGVLATRGGKSETTDAKSNAAAVQPAEAKKDEPKAEEARPIETAAVPEPAKTTEPAASAEPAKTAEPVKAAEPAKTAAPVVTAAPAPTPEAPKVVAPKPAPRPAVVAPKPPPPAAKPATKLKEDF